MMLAIGADPIDRRVYEVAEYDGELPNNNPTTTWYLVDTPYHITEVLLSEYVWVYRNTGLVKTNQPKVPERDTDTWNAAIEAWVDDRTLEQHREDKWTEIKAARDAVEYGQLTFESNVYDIDAVSQQRIFAAVQLAQIDPLTTVDWTTADNATVTLNATQLLDLGTALTTHINAAHETARTLRIDIDNAQTIEEVEAITWP